MHIPLEQISEADLQSLINERVPESRYIDYKRETYETGDDAKAELRADATAFANTVGGDIVIGIGEDKNNQPTKIFPFIGNIDQEIRRINEILRHNVQPKIAVQLRAIPISDGGNVVIIRIQRSYNPPHMVTKNTYKLFYGRMSGGKQLLEVDELRRLFNNRRTAELIRVWRTERVDKLVQNITPVPLSSSGRLVVHIVPFSAFDCDNVVNLKDARNHGHHFMPLGRTSGDCTINFDGVVYWSHASGDKVPQGSYNQLFHSGCIESVTTTGLEENDIYMSKTIEDIQGYIPQYLDGLSKCGIETPVAILISLLNVKGRRAILNNSSGYILHDHMHFMETIIDKIPSNKKEYGTLLKRTLDHLANVTGAMSFTTDRS